jgi:hypothetical protein
MFRPERWLAREVRRGGGYAAGLKLAIERGWLVMHESRTFVKLEPVPEICTGR